MKDKHTIVIKIEDDKIVDLVQLSYGEVIRMPTNPVYKTFPTKELIVFLYDTELHLSLKPGGLKGKKLLPKNFIADPKLVSGAIKSLLDAPDTNKELKEWLFKKIAEVCAVPRKNLKKKE